MKPEKKLRVFRIKSYSEYEFVAHYDMIQALTMWHDEYDGEVDEVEEVVTLPEKEQDGMEMENQKGLKVNIKEWLKEKSCPGYIGATYW